MLLDTSTPCSQPDDRSTLGFQPLCILIDMCDQVCLQHQGEASWLLAGLDGTSLPFSNSCRPRHNGIQCLRAGELEGLRSFEMHRCGHDVTHIEEMNKADICPEWCNKGLHSMKFQAFHHVVNFSSASSASP